MPQEREVSINGVQGRGYAEVIEGPNGLKDCRGHITLDPAGAAQIQQDFTEDKELVYSGVVYRAGQPIDARFQVLIPRMVTSGPAVARRTFHFEASGDPFAERA